MHKSFIGVRNVNVKHIQNVAWLVWGGIISREVALRPRACYLYGGHATSDATPFKSACNLLFGQLVAGDILAEPRLGLGIWVLPN